MVSWVNIMGVSEKGREISSESVASGFGGCEMSSDEEVMGVSLKGSCAVGED